jgi:hypothetical protein
MTSNKTIVIIYTATQDEGQEHQSRPQSAQESDAGKKQECTTSHLLKNHPNWQKRNHQRQRNKKPMSRSQSGKVIKSNDETTHHHDNEPNQRTKQHQFTPRQGKRPCVQSHGKSRAKWKTLI